MPKEDTQFSNIVKYNNQLNTLALGKLNARELDMFLTICSVARDQQSNEIVLSFNQIKQLSNYTATQNKRFIADLTATNRKLMAMDFTMVNEDNTVCTQFVLFPTFKTDINTKTLTVKVNEDFSFLLNDLTANFTRFELAEYVNLKTKYGKLLYQLLKQYRKTGLMIMEIEEFRRVLDIPETYRISDIDKRVLKPALEEVGPYFKGLAIKKERNKNRKNKVTHIKFFFQKEEGVVAKGLHDVYPGRKTKKKVENGFDIPLFSDDLTLDTFPVWSEDETDIKNRF